MKVTRLRKAAFFSLSLALCSSVAYAANDTWGANASTAWYTVGNWASATQFPGLQGAAASNTDIATFTSAATATTFGINMNTASLNLGAIVFDSTRTTATNIGNSSSAAPGFLRLYGATANSVANTILWNAGSGNVTLQASQSGTMGAVLGNTSNVIQITGGGGITVSSNLTQINANSGLTLQGAGGGFLTLSGTNTYTGATSIAASNTLQFAAVASLYNGTTSSWTAANLNVSGTLALNVGGANQFTAGNVTTLLTNLGGLGGAVSNNGLRAGSRIAFDTSGGNFTVADNITNSTGTGGGAIGLTKLGSGVLTLTGTNSFTGGVTIATGTIRAGSNAAIGTNSTLVGNGSVANSVFASADATPLTFTKTVSTNLAGGGITFGDATGTGDLTFTGNLTRASGATARGVNVAGTTTVTFNGNLTSPGSNNTTTFTKGGTGTLVIRGTGNGADPGFSNVVVTSGVLAVTRLANLGTASSLGTATAATAGAVSITLNGGALNYVTGGAAASSTDRLLQIGQTTAGGTGTIRNNATNALETLTFSNPNAIAYGTTNQTRNLVLGGTNTGSNTLASAINNNGIGVVDLTKADSGTWVLSGANTYTGATTISGGTLSLSGAGSLASGSYAGAITNNGTFNYDSSTPQTFSGLITGTGALTKTGSGTLTLSGNNTGWSGSSTLSAGTTVAGNANGFGSGVITLSAGATFDLGGLAVTNNIVNLGGTITDASNYAPITSQILSGTSSYSGTVGGTLAVNTGGTIFGNATFTGVVTLNSGGTAKGTGNFTGGLTINSGATLSPGNSPGIMTATNTTWNGGSTYDFQILDTSGTAGTGWDLLAITGTLDLTGASFGNPITVKLTSLVSILPDVLGNAAGFDIHGQNQVWTIVSTTVGISGYAANKFIVDVTGFSNDTTRSWAWSVSQSGNSLQLAYVPEPSAYAGLAGLAVLSLAWKRRRQRQVSLNSIPT